MVLASISLLITLLSGSNERLQLIFFIISMCFGVILLSIDKIAGKYINLMKKTNSEKYHINVCEYKHFVNYISKNLKFDELDLKVSDDVLGNIFYKVDKHWYNFFGREISIVFIVNMERYIQEKLELALDKLDEKLSQCIKNCGENDYIEMTLILCLQTSNKEFIKYIDKDVFQTSNFIKLPIGVVFDNQSMYISKQESFLGKGKYKKLKEKVLKLLKGIIE